MRGLKKIWKHLLVFSFCLLIPLLIAVRGVQLPAPEQYEVAGQNIPAITDALGAEAATFDDQKTKAPSAEETSAGVISDVSHFRYQELNAGAKTVEAYIQYLTKPEQGFEAVDETGLPAELPDFSDEGGSIILKRSIADSQDKLWMQLLWEDTRLSLSSYLRAPTEEEKAEKAADTIANRGLSAGDAVIYLKTASPSSLGLPGETMADYNVYYADGKAKVDGVSCMRLRVYALGQPQGTNTYLGTYFLSGDQSRLFRLDPETNQIEELKQ